MTPCPAPFVGWALLASGDHGSLSQVMWLPPASGSALVVFGFAEAEPQCLQVKTFRFVAMRRKRARSVPTAVIPGTIVFCRAQPGQHRQGLSHALDGAAPTGSRCNRGFGDGPDCELMTSGRDATAIERNKHERSLTDEKGWLTYKVARGLGLPGSKPDEDLMRTDGV